MSKFYSLSSAVRRSFALAVVAGSALAVAGAQNVAQNPSGTETATGPAQPIRFQAPTPALGADSEAQFSSSVTSDADASGSDAANSNLASLETNFKLPGVNAQYGRRRYGAPRYRGSNTNADGSEKYDVFVGGGFTLPVGTNSNYLKTSYGLQVGGGRNFNQHLGVNLQFDYDRFGFTGQTLTNQAYLDLGDTTGNTEYGLDGNSHIWSFTLDPIYYLKSGEGIGVYVTGGGGFYHKTANFFVPVEAQGYDYYSGFVYDYTADETVDKYTSNSAGVNFGVGFTYKFSRFANERLYGEVRYVHTFNNYRPGVTVANAATTTYDGYNLFPQNSNSTSYLPVKFGIRF